MSDTLFVFPDTNVFLHYPPLSHIDWPTLCKSAKVQLVVCIAVIHELDAKKSDSRLGDRAKRAIKLIRESHSSGTQLRDGVTLTIFNQECRRSDFEECLSPDSGDDRIVHLARTYQQQQLEAPVAIATEDLGMELRCEAGGIPVLHMDHSIRLPDPQDELSKKHQQTLQELDSLKRRLPVLKLSTSDSNPLLRHEIDDLWKPVDINTQMTQLRERFPYADNRSLLGRRMGEMASQRYNDYLNEFFKEYQEYLEIRNIQADAKSKCITFELLLSNEGNGIGTDIDVNVAFPSSIKLIMESGTKDAEVLEYAFEAPDPPDKPDFDDWPNILDPHDWRKTALAETPELDLLRPLRRDDMDPDCTIVKMEDGSREIRVRLKKLKHEHNIVLGKFFAVFASYESASPFGADFFVSAAELPQRVEGKLHFIVQRKSKAPASEKQPLSSTVGEDANA